MFLYTLFCQLIFILSRDNCNVIILLNNKLPVYIGFFIF